MSANSNSRTIINGAVSTVLAAAAIWVAGMAWRAINPDASLSATVISAQVAPVPPQLVEQLVDGGCDSLLRADEFRSLELRDARLAECRALTTRFNEAVAARDFRLVRVQIENDGRAPAENVRVVADNYDYARVITQAQQPQDFGDDAPITVGTVVPGESVEVQLWSQYDWGVPLADVQVYSNSGKATRRPVWVDESALESDYMLESVTILILNSGFAWLLGVLAFFGALLVFALIGELLKLLGGTQASPQVANQSEG